MAKQLSGKMISLPIQYFMACLISRLCGLHPMTKNNKIIRQHHFRHFISNYLNHIIQYRRIILFISANRMQSIWFLNFHFFQLHINNLFFHRHIFDTSHSHFDIDKSFFLSNQKQQFVVC